MSSKEELKLMKTRIKYYDTVEIDLRIAVLSTELIETFSLSHGLQIPDAIVVATAIIHNLEIFTYNLKDFRCMPGIKLYL